MRSAVCCHPFLASTGRKDTTEKRGSEIPRLLKFFGEKGDLSARQPPSNLRKGSKITIPTVLLCPFFFRKMLKTERTEPQSGGTRFFPFLFAASKIGPMAHATFRRRATANVLKNSFAPSFLALAHNPSQSTRCMLPTPPMPSRDSVLRPPPIRSILFK